MTDYLNVDLSNLEPDDPLTDDILQSLSENPKAIAEGSATGDGAPVNQAFWHPYDMVTVGDGATGVIFDHAAAGDSASFTTPTLADGYEYRLIGSGIGRSTANSFNFQLEWFLESGSAYSAPVPIGSAAGIGALLDFDLDFKGLRRVRRGGTARGEVVIDGNPEEVFGEFTNNTAQKVTNLRGSLVSGLIGAGSVSLVRRRTLVP